MADLGLEDFISTVAKKAGRVSDIFFSAKAKAATSRRGQLRVA